MNAETLLRLPVYLLPHPASDLPRSYPEIFKRALAKKGPRRER